MTFDEVTTGGEALLQESILQETQETLQLDFKGSAVGKQGALFTDEGKLTKDGRRSIAKAMSAFSNSAGGVVVIGVDCRTVDGVDAAQALDPIPNWKAALSAVSSLVGDLLQPKNDGVRVAGFASAKDDRAGYLVIDVPRSERRPHMCNMAKQYFKRSASSSYAMEHFDIEDAFRRSGSPDLDLVCDFTGGMSSGTTVHGSIRLAIRNAGLATAKHISLMVVERSGVKTKNGGSHRQPLTKFQMFSQDQRYIAPEGFVVNPGETQIFENLGMEFTYDLPMFKASGISIESATFVLRYSLSAENMRPKLGTLSLGPADFKRGAWLLKPDYIQMKEPPAVNGSLSP
ncbi:MULTISPECIES: ATP-binding protein [unclassified Mesorhizobium]|uniref:AlbA family DNA-binding domain-containing protein n=1 Tax=unclassified Mesorhizobium TaxID=325217 RepID=UPI000FCC1C3F|nr:MULTISPECIES: ATP-binding protein [unclassified Mesorhizobium]RUX95828.1 ATP-binding protein [Mesorhizobium sp. M7D.F.Ca.US.004.01.2.1]RVA25266.1 ATP-binding protein [Mesorhizobium sp. M7D.F.Ca.US.004.03.1.1]